MIELAAAAVVAKLVSDAVGAIDKIFRGYADFAGKKIPGASNIPPPDFAYVDSPQQGAFIAKSRMTGDVYQTVTYEELRSKLEDENKEYIETLSRAMMTYQKQWNSAFEQRAMASGMEIGKMDAQLDYLAKQIADPLSRVLDFVEKMGLSLEDHYLMARHVAKDYIAR